MLQLFSRNILRYIQSNCSIAVKGEDIAIDFPECVNQTCLALKENEAFLREPGFPVNSDSTSSFDYITWLSPFQGFF